MSEELKPFAYLIWMQGIRGPDDVEDYYEVAQPDEKSIDGSPAFPVYDERALAAKDAEIEKLKAALELGCTAVAELALEILGEDQSGQAAARLIERAGPASSLGIMRAALKGDAQ